MGSLLAVNHPLKLGVSGPQFENQLCGVDRARHKSTARVLDPPSPLLQLDGLVEPTSTPTLIPTSTHTSACTPSTSTAPATPSPAPPSPPPPPGERIWRHAVRRAPKPPAPAHLIPGVPGPGHPPWPWPTGPLDTCTLCGRHPTTLDYTTPGWGGLCTVCAYKGPLKLNLKPSPP